MPPIQKVKKQDIIHAAYEIVAKEGFSGISARALAKHLNCSIQPIFHNFQSMEELNQATYDKIYEKYQEYMLSGRDKSEFYKQMGLSYIQFARDYPEFFKILFMQSTNLNAEGFLMSDAAGDDVVRASQKFTGLSFEESKKFHVKVWIFTHGIACLVATKTVEFTEKEIDELLANTVREMLNGYLENKKEEKQ